MASTVVIIKAAIKAAVGEEAITAGEDGKTLEDVIGGLLLKPLFPGFWL